VIDCNRALDAPTSIPPFSDAVPIPATRISTSGAAGARGRIVRAVPSGIDQRLDAFAARGAKPCSCGAFLHAAVRRVSAAWHFGVL